MKMFRTVCEHCPHVVTADAEPKAITLMAKHEGREHPAECPEPFFPLIICTETDCEAMVKGDRWARINATNAGWFFQKTGESWCGDHNPPWVVHWRKTKTETTKKGPS